jgi:hypothetical protein
LLIEYSREKGNTVGLKMENSQIRNSTTHTLSMRLCALAVRRKESMRTVGWKQALSWTSQKSPLASTELRPDYREREKRTIEKAKGTEFESEKAVIIRAGWTKGKTRQIWQFVGEFRFRISVAFGQRCHVELGIMQKWLGRALLQTKFDHLINWSFQKRQLRNARPKAPLIKNRLYNLEVRGPRVR